MRIIQKLTDTITSNKITHWDSRVQCRHRLFEQYLPHEFLDFLQTHEDISEYKYCFLNSVFIEHIIPNVTKQQKHFISCKIEVSNLMHFLPFFLDNNFSKCTFYIDNTLTGTDWIHLNPEIKELLNSNGNKIINLSYIKALCKKYKNNLSNAPVKELIGLNINNTNLTDVVLPKNKDFFTNLADTTINKVQLPELNFNTYDLTNISFCNTTFTKQSVLSKEMISSGLIKCLLPVIDFNNYYKTTNQYFAIFRECIFRKNTIFLNDKDFFNKVEFSDCILPDYDFSSYSLNATSLQGCYISDNSKLPNDIFTQNKISFLDNILSIPLPCISNYIHLAHIADPDNFYLLYKSKLSHNDLFLLYKKYNIAI